MAAPVIAVQYAAPRRGVPAAATLRRYARAALAGHRGRAELALRVVDETEGAGLNGRFRGRGYPTNVLSFPMDGPAGPCLGDVVVCAPVVAREAREQGKAPAAHWAHMVVHGVLHLLGHDHEDPQSARAMEARERALLDRLGFPDPYGS